METPLETGTRTRIFRGGARRPRAALMAAAVVALTFQLVAAPPAWAPTAVELTGNWAGFTQAIGNPDLRGPSSLVVTTQQGRRFSAEISIGNPDIVDDPDYRVDGTIAESGRINMGGRSLGGHLVVKGRLNPVAGICISPPCDPIWSLFEGDWVMNRPGGKTRGQIALLHLMGDASLARGHWEGEASSYTDTGFAPVSADFGREGGPEGNLSIGTDSFRTYIDIMVGNPDTKEAEFALVGGGEAGIIIIGGKLLPTPTEGGARIEGLYRLLAADGSVLEGDIALEMR